VTETNAIRGTDMYSDRLVTAMKTFH